MSVRTGVLWRALGLVAIVSCHDGLGPTGAAPSPRNLQARAMGISSVRLSWDPVAGEEVIGYRILRRIDHAGAFVALQPLVPQRADPMVFVDTDVLPETFYGYRVAAVTRYGSESPPSVAAATRTPPPPGVLVETRSEAPVAEAMDPDGYRVFVTGPDSAAATIGLSASHRFAPLRAGVYTVALRNVASRCEVSGDSTRSVTVTDTGLATLAEVAFLVRCRDPRRGRIVVPVRAEGDSADAGGFRVIATGVLHDATLPDSLRVVRLDAAVAPAGGIARFDNLRPGSYEVELSGADAHCLLAEPVRHTVDVRESSTDTVRFVVTCNGTRAPADTARALVWTNRWSAAAVAPGQKATLFLALDASARPGIRVAAAQGELRFDPSLLRYEAATASPDGGLDGVTAQLTSPGVLAVLMVHNSGVGFAGLVPMAAVEFTAIGAAGSVAATRTRIIEVVDAGANLLQDSTRVVEDTVAIASTGSTSMPPVANANGPYSGSVGASIAFSAAGSADPDGGALTYRWEFGDGSAPATTSAPSASHAYAAAGGYTLRLVVTDDEGAADTAQASVTITAEAAVPGKPYVWRNTWSPSTASAGQQVVLTAVVDASAAAGQNVAAVGANIRYDSTALRFSRSEVVTPNGLNGLTVNGTNPGIVSLAAIDNNGVGLTGIVGVARIEFTVLSGAAGSITTRTELVDLSDSDLNALLDSTRIVEGTLAVGSAGSNQLPIARANGPYTGLTGQSVTFSAAGSSDPDGGALRYRWNFGDGAGESTEASPSHVYSTAGSYTVTLTVTDDEGGSATATTTATISAPATTLPLEWRYAFSVVGDTLAVLEILYDLQTDIPETSGQEALATWVVDSLKWNPAVLRYVRMSSFGKGGGSVNETFSSLGKLSLAGSIQAPFNTGLVQIATIQFRIVGAAGSGTTTQTALGALRNAGGFDYRSRTAIREATFTRP